MILNCQKIGRNIHHHRLRCNLNQKEFGEKVNISEQHIIHIENGHTQLSLPTLVAISNALDLGCSTLLGETVTGGRELLIN